MSAKGGEVSEFCLPTAEAAGLAEMTAGLRWKLALAGQPPHLEPWIQLEKQRGQTETAATMLEKLAPSEPSNQRPMIWQQAADLYHKSGDAAAELRVLTQLAGIRMLDGETQQRFYGLLLERDPQQLIALAQLQDAAAQYVVRHGDRAQAVAAVAARGSSRAPVWGSAYTALAGFYQGDFDPRIGQAFSTALDADATIGERVAHPANRDRQIAGETWFYYGSRFGEFLDDIDDPHSEDFLASGLESTPQSPGAYVQLADYSEQKGRADAALGDDEQALELKADQPAVLDRVATIEWQQGRRPEALSAWSQAVKLLAAEIDARPVPETFWGDFAQVVKSVNEHGQYESIRQPVDNLLRVYIGRSGDYLSRSLIEAAYHANGDSADWLIAIASSANDREGLLHSLIDSSWPSGTGWIRNDQIGTLLARVLDLEEKKAEQNPNEDRRSVDQTRRHLVTALIEGKKFAEARDLLAQVPARMRLSGAWLSDVLEVAQTDGTLNQLLGEWGKPGIPTPVLDDLRDAAARLDDAGKRIVMRFVYERALATRDFSAPNFLGLAAIDLDDGDTSGAIDLLKRMTLVSSDMDADRDAAAHLLEDRKMPAAAIPLLRSLVEDEPWNAGFRVRLGAALIAVSSADTEGLGLLNAVVGDSKASYLDRTAAAHALKGSGASSSGSGELQLIAQAGCPTVVAASRPYFVTARAAAGACTSDAKTREHLLREALALEPWSGEIRLDYIWAAFGAEMDFRALVAAEPLLQQWGGYGRPEYSTFESDGAPSADQAAGRQQALSIASLKPTEAARLFFYAVRAEERRRDFGKASTLVQSALNDLHDSSLRKPFELEQKRLAAELSREAENDLRVPNVHAELVQDRLARPRLVVQRPFVPLQIPGKEVQP